MRKFIVDLFGIVIIVGLCVILKQEYPNIPAIGMAAGFAFGLGRLNTPE